MKKILFIALTITLATSAKAQKEAWNWYFGMEAGVSFATGEPVALTDGVLSQWEGVASMSDADGNLLFYTDGSTVYNANHSAMPNGTGLLGNPSSTQSSIVVKKPGSANLYYVFTVDYNHEDISVIGTGFCYSVVDMTLDGGMGDIDVAEKNVVVRQQAFEKLTAVKHGNNTDFWILINDWIDDAIYAYHLSETGLDLEPVISDVGPIHGHTLNTLGYMKASSQSDRLALARLDYNSFAVLDFDNNTGIASNRIDINGTNTTLYRTYGVEFSPDGSKLYGTTLGVPFKTIQFDLSSEIGDTIYKYRTVLDSSMVQGCNYYYGAVQLGPDGKIYGVIECDSALNVINDPDELGTLCNFQSHAVSLEGKLGRLGLPNFVTTNVITGISEEVSDKLELELYPNPASETLTITTGGSAFLNLQCRIYDLSGAVVEELNTMNSTTTMNLGSLSSGMYVLKAEKGDQVINRKLSVVRGAE